jgi:hypothetical protein
MPIPMRDERLTAGDGIAVVITAAQAVLLLAFPFLVARPFNLMFRDMGFNQPFPLLTRLALSAWFPMSLGATTAIGPVLACIPAVPLVHRRRTLVGAFVFGCAAIGACIAGMYLPVFDLAVFKE